MLNRIVLLAALLSFHSFAGEPVILLTGFEPFGGAKVNASWEAVRVYQGKTIAGHRVETLELPVVYDAVEAPLKAAIAKFKPTAVICFGEGPRVIQIETVARNSYNPAKPPDNKGQPPPREKIIPDGPDTIRSGLPVDAIRNSIESTQVHPITSEEAGGYLCNECFYRLMAMPEAPPIRGFIHLPVFNSIDAYTLSDLKRAVGVAASVSVGKPPVRILALSDGFLEGLREEQLPSLLAEKLQADGVAVQDPSVYRIREIPEKEKFESFLSPQKFEYIVLQHGINEHMNGSAARNYSIREALVSMRKYEPRQIIVLSLPDFTVTAWGRRNGYNSEISQRKLRNFNTVLAEQAAEADALFVDITPDTVNFADDKTLFTENGFHYSRKMNEILAERVYNALKAKKMLPK